MSAGAHREYASLDHRGDCHGCARTERSASGCSGAAGGGNRYGIRMPALRTASIAGGREDIGFRGGQRSAVAAHMEGAAIKRLIASGAGKLIVDFSLLQMTLVAHIAATLLYVVD